MVFDPQLSTSKSCFRDSECCGDCEGYERGGDLRVRGKGMEKAVVRIVAGRRDIALSGNVLCMRSVTLCRCKVRKCFLCFSKPLHSSDADVDARERLMLLSLCRYPFVIG